MTLRSMYRPTPLSQPISIPRGWMIVGAAVLSWFALILAIYGVIVALTWLVGLLP